VAALEDSQNACVYSWPSVSFAPPVRVSVADSRSQYLTSPAAATARLPNSTPATRSLTAVPVCFAASSRNVGFGAVWECAVVASSATDASRSGSCIALPSRDRPRDVRTATTCRATTSYRIPSGSARTSVCPTLSVSVCVCAGANRQRRGKSGAWFGKSPIGSLPPPMRDAVNSTYLPVVLEIAGYAAV
jgi:hypothetical protein